MSREPAPALLFERAPCPKCGATTAQEAETLCKPIRGVDDEWTCPAGEQEDAEGYLLQPTRESIKALDAWCDREIEDMFYGDDEST